MMRPKTLVSVAVLLAGTAHFSVRAEGIALGLTIGTLGPGAQAAIRVHERGNVRIGGSGFGISYDDEKDGVEYHTKLRMGSIPVIVDVYPISRVPLLRFSGGLALNETRLQQDARPISGSVEVGNTVYNANEIGRIDRSATYRGLAPYLGVGWGNAFGAGKNWSWNADVGVMYLARPKTTYAATCGAVQTRCGLLQTDAAIEADEHQRESRRDRAYPVLQFWVGKRF